MSTPPPIVTTNIHDIGKNDTDQQPPRPILKCATDPSLPSSNTHLKWDEETIKLHDAERGTRMKIDEPKTPWTGPVHSIVDLDGGVPPLLLSEAILKIEPRPNKIAISLDSVDSVETVAVVDDDSDRHRHFEQLRSQHYNMRQALLKAKELMDESEDDDEK